MMNQRITNLADMWLILRTSGAQTLRLATSLTEVGFDVWTPKRTYKRPKPGKCELIDGRKPTVEIDAPILPTFVFARAHRQVDLIAAIAEPASKHPAFSIFCHTGRVPYIGDGSIAGLRAEEQREAELLLRLREAEGREERRRIRAEAATTERERRRALQAERSFKNGDAVVVDEMPAFAGMTGVVVGERGRAMVVSFGGSLTLEIEAWQLSPDEVQAVPS